MRRDDQQRGAATFRASYLLWGAGLVAATLAVSTVLTSGSAQARSTATPPANTAAPAITGTPLLGATLTASSGSWSGDAPITFAYQWRRCNEAGASCSDVPGATGATRVITSDDVGSTLRVQVTATNGAGSSVVQSDATGKVTSSSAPVNTKEPTVSGTLAQVRR